MTLSEKAKEKLDEASKEIREAIDSLKVEVADLTNKVKDKLKGSGEEMRESAEELTQKVKELSEKVKELVPKRKKSGLPMRFEKSLGYQTGTLWDHPFLELRKATDRLFDDFYRSFGGALSDRRGPWGLGASLYNADWPRVDMDENDEEIRITAELPGVESDKIDVSVTGDRIAIRGEKREQEEKKGRNYHALERSYGSFQRSFYLPCEVDPDRVEAFFKNGVLTVRLPKSDAARDRVRKIPVRIG